MSRTKVSGKGSVVIPRDVREALGIQPGDVLDFVLVGSGTVSVRRTDHIPLERLKGAWKRQGDPRLSDDDVADAIRRGASRRCAR